MPVVALAQQSREETELGESPVGWKWVVDFWPRNWVFGSHGFVACSCRWAAEPESFGMGLVDGAAEILVNFAAYGIVAISWVLVCGL